MDVFAATIPEECRAPLLERIYERDSDNDDTETPLKRPRSNNNTDTLLSPEPGELAQEVPESPPPVEEDLSRYTRERIKAGLRYIHHTIATGTITPRTFTFLNLSKEAHNIALDCFEEKTETPSKKAVAVIQQYDEVYASESFLLHPRSAEELQRMENLTKLRRVQILANYYGDGVEPASSQEQSTTNATAARNQRAGEEATPRQTAIPPPPDSWLTLEYRIRLTQSIPS
ncbi:MAG: hypothetical protein OHK93_008366 [Ramalina farinacea]|uniref:Uncharacterized protein n=1 Tax=Ramalina farinacea TaxID=258253 RepID=A0AA43QMA9_9LECA|nr:hypothetical protein [Ramalina farinacea]